MLGVLAVVAFNSGGENESSQNQQSRAVADRSLLFKPAPIDPGVFRKYDKASYPRVYAAFGEGIVTGPMQAMREKIARHAANQLECGHVEGAEFSDNESGPGGIAVFADCANGMRYYLNADDRIWSKKVF